MGGGVGRGGVVWGGAGVEGRVGAGAGQEDGRRLGGVKGHIRIATYSKSVVVPSQGWNYTIS